MTIHAIVHKAEEGGFWAEVPSIPGSHHIYAKAGSPVRISVPIHGHDRKVAARAKRTSAKYHSVGL